MTSKWNDKHLHFISDKLGVSVRVNGVKRTSDYRLYMQHRMMVKRTVMMMRTMTLMTMIIQVSMKLAYK